MKRILLFLLLLNFSAHAQVYTILGLGISKLNGISEKKTLKNLKWSYQTLIIGTDTIQCRRTNIEDLSKLNRNGNLALLGSSLSSLERSLSLLKENASAGKAIVETEIPNFLNNIKANYPDFDLTDYRKEFNYYEILSKKQEEAAYTAKLEKERLEQEDYKATLKKQQLEQERYKADQEAERLKEEQKAIDNYTESEKNIYGTLKEKQMQEALAAQSDVRRSILIGYKLVYADLLSFYIQSKLDYHMEDSKNTPGIMKYNYTKKEVL